jgi:Cys-tRNA(Pro)/Cys-tRNA(Cys) deacylase
MRYHRLMCSSKADPAGTPALIALVAAKVPHVVHEYAHDPASDLGYGLEAATTLGVDSSRVFKTLLVAVAEQLVVAVVPVDAQLDLKAVASAVGGQTGEAGL